MTDDEVAYIEAKGWKASVVPELSIINLSTDSAFVGVSILLDMACINGRGPAAKRAIDDGPVPKQPSHVAASVHMLAQLLDESP